MRTLKDYILTENNFFKNLGIGQEVQIRKWLDEHDIEKYTINDDLTIDVKGSVDLNGFTDKKLPDYIQFGKITEYFYIYGCPKLESLEGCPKEVGIDFYCFNCKNLESLKGAPKEVGSDFWCNNCSNLKSLEGCPKKVGGGFWCYNSGKRFTEDDIKKICKVKGIIIA